MASTYYTKNGKQIPAKIKILDATPKDTTIAVTPQVPGGTYHEITWPAVKSDTKSSVRYMRDEGEPVLVEDFDNDEYWLEKGREALRNIKFNWLEKLLGKDKIIKKE